MAASVLKDAAFAQMFGASPTKAAVPAVSYALFALRDGLTVASGFLLPGALGSAAASLTGREEAQCTQAAQLVTPSLLQLVCTPVHLLALNMYNAPVATVAERIRDVWRVAPATVVAFGIRMAPAFGIGGIMNAARFALLPDGAILVNAARGAVIDDDALVDALKSGKLFAAGIDAYNNEPNVDNRLISLDNTFLLPHIGSANRETRDAMGFRALDNLDAFFAGREPRDRVA